MGPRELDRMTRGAEVHWQLAAAGERGAAQTAGSAAVAAELPAVAPWMVHPECSGFAAPAAKRLFAQRFASGVKLENRCLNFGRPKWMKALWRQFPPPETTLPIVSATESPV